MEDYISIEDLGTSFRKNLESSYADSIITGYEFCAMIAEKVTECLMYGNNDCNLLKDEVEEIAKEVEMISFCGQSCIMIKR